MIESPDGEAVKPPPETPVIVGVGFAYGSLTTRLTDLESRVVDMNQMAIDIAVIKEKIENIDNKMK